MEQTPETTQKSQLVALVEQSGLEKTKQDFIIEKFNGFQQIATDWKNKSEAIKVTDISQTAEMKMAREGRLFLKSKRVEIEKTRKELKEQSIKEGKAIDLIASSLRLMIEPIEEYLDEQEKFAERKEAERRAALKDERIEKLAPYEVDHRYFDLENMPEDQFNSLLESSKNTYELAQAAIKKAEEDRIAAEKKAEEERIAKEKAEAEEQERIRQENEKLRQQYIKEKEEREAEEQRNVDKANKFVEILLQNGYTKLNDFLYQKSNFPVNFDVLKKFTEEEFHQRLKEVDDRIQERQEAEDRKKEAEDRRLELERRNQEQRDKDEAEKRRLKMEADKKQQELDKIQREQREKEEAAKKLANAPDKDKLVNLAHEIFTFPMPQLASEEGKAIVSKVKTLLVKVEKFINEELEKL